ncbi:hypothetical protein [Roseomonas indoligenes]|uniref:HNH endonuclease n=1 Tax=Roseomonas indoligenes TaxID=2820811 RepID=A0A940S6P8_9PROT|nr:hypothetical protein [Pararoseomonas indoligenes]MBP0492223.1 hypothetical protein [Pararoseomonas indoligenes]
MPIRASERARYPKDWPAISKRIRERSGGRCEFEADGARCEALNGQPHPITGSKVVLTVAHLDHTPENCADDNLLAGCQRCHLRYDAAHHAANAAASRRAALQTRDLLAQEDR